MNAIGFRACFDRCYIHEGKRHSHRIRLLVDMADDYPTAKAVVDIVLAELGRRTFEGEEGRGWSGPLPTTGDAHTMYIT